MATRDKVKNTAQQIRGKLKGAVGRLIGNKRLQAAGKSDEMKGDIGQVAEKLKDAIKN